MTLYNVITYGHHLLRDYLNAGDIAVDGTVGNGYDTVFLADTVGASGHVYGFDIQELAIENTRKKLDDKAMSDRVTLYHQSHHVIGKHLHDKKIKAAIFNLGYLPGGDKSVVTIPETTIEAVCWLANHIVANGIIIVVVYPGHPEGEIESNVFLDYVQSLDQHEFNVLKYEFLNRQNKPPYLIAIEKKRPGK